ncbi:MAG: FtsX-like permease family protein [Gammaproteobacteria bacterium]|nr:FtsX-like permease family protein [Gammaproteobacteria bacterium]
MTISNDKTLQKHMHRQSPPKRNPGISFFWNNSWRMLWRDWRGGELTILAIALIIAVTSITAVGFFTDRIERGLKMQSAELIAGDLVISSRRADVNNHIIEARSNNFRVTTTQQFRSVLFADESFQLAEVKVVSEGYPLRGVLRVSDSAFGADEATTGIPAPGELWVEARLLQLLKLKIGDSIKLGEVSFTIRKIIRYEPDRAGDLFSVAPRVMMNSADLDATGLISTGALVSYRVLIAGDSESINDYHDVVKDQLQPGEQIIGVEEGRPELNTALKSARQFLGLAALISVLLAGVAVATIANRFSTRHLNTSAMMRCLGSSQKTIIKLFTLEMLWLSLLASTIGCLLGALTQLVITELLDKLVLTQLPPPSWKALILGYATGIIMLIGFALPPLLSLHRVPPLHVLRKDIPKQPVSVWTIYIAVISCMSLLLYWQIGDLQLVVFVIGGILLTLITLAAGAYLLIMLLNRQRARVGIAWRFGLANITRRPGSSVIQIVAFGLGIMVLLLLSTVRSDLLDGWQKSLPTDAPNYFVINVQTDQVDEIRNFFTSLGVKKTRLYPMVRARLVEVNGLKVDSSNYQSERAKRFVTREFNLSWAEQMQQDNEVVSGQWWNQQDHGQPLLSLESGLAETLGLQVNDVVSFDINGSKIDLTISNLRSVDWDTFNVNFFTVLPPGVLEDKPANWVTSVYLNSEQRQQLGKLVRDFSNVTLIDIEIIMQRVRGIIDRVSLAVEFVFMFTLLAGLAVLYAAIQSNQDERRFESAVLRTLGASRKTLMLGLFAEFSLLGAISGLLAGLAATSLAWLLAVYIFKFDYTFDITVAITGLVSGIVIVVSAGILGTRSVLSTPPIETLRQGSA